MSEIIMAIAMWCGTNGLEVRSANECKHRIFQCFLKKQDAEKYRGITYDRSLVSCLNEEKTK